MHYSTRYRALVTGTLAAAFLVVVWGGVVRVSGSGLGCPDWPLCHGAFLPSLDTATRIEWTHRFLALAAAVMLGTLAVVTYRAHRRERAVARLVAFAIPLFALQAVLGAITVVLELPDTWVTLHLANAELLLADLVALVIVVWWPRSVPGLAPPSTFSWLALAAAGGTFALLLSGAYVRGDGATTACTTWPLCDGGLPAPAGLAFVHMAHRYVAAVVGIVVLFAAAEGWQRRREVAGAGPLSIAVVALFAAQVAIGAANPLTGFSPLPLGAHPAVASALWCAVIALAIVAWRPSLLGASTTVRAAVALTKPAIMSLLLVTALGGMFLAAHGVPPFHLVAATLVGGACASGGASSLNHFFDRDIDERMRRTRRRPLPANRISARAAVVLGIVLNAVGFAVLALGANLLAAALAIAGTLFYIFVYTLWLKRATVQNIVIGGAAGAIPPLVGWAAVAGSLDLPAWYLFAIVFFWTPAHFWALALLIRDDYGRAGVPMLPVVRGERDTAWGILLYAASLIPLTVLLFLTGAVGLLYLLAAFALGIVFVAYAVRLVRSAEERRRGIARSLYLYSLLYLTLLFVAIMVDTTLRI
ncbi:MAG: heme o synthase [Candidatus Limnocylindria bacterium]